LRETGRSSEELAEEALLRYVEYESWKAQKIRDAVGRADAGDFASDEEMQAVFDRYRPANASRYRSHFLPCTHSLPARPAGALPLRPAHGLPRSHIAGY
jgi:predicted transcriptional regulator